MRKLQERKERNKEREEEKGKERKTEVGQMSVSERKRRERALKLGMRR